MPVNYEEELKARLTDLMHLAEILIRRTGLPITPVLWSALSQRTDEIRALLDALAHLDKKLQPARKHEGQDR